MLNVASIDVGDQPFVPLLDQSDTEVTDERVVAKGFAVRFDAKATGKRRQG